MKRPLIGITTDHNDPPTQYASPFGYAQSVERAGGLPLLLPYRTDVSLIPQIVDTLDGIVFSGGSDLDPAAWGETRAAGTEPIDPQRESFERALIAEVQRRRLPALGICLGSQLMNVCRGGSLVQFLPAVDRSEPLEHRKLNDWNRRHVVKMEPGSIAATTVGRDEIVTNTSHKQAVAKLGKGLRVVATAPDGVIEGIEDPTMPLYLGVQWHPERMSDQPEHLALFQLLIEKAREASKR